MQSPTKKQKIGGRDTCEGCVGDDIKMKQVDFDAGQKQIDDLHSSVSNYTSVKKDKTKLLEEVKVMCDKERKKKEPTMQHLQTGEELRIILEVKKKREEVVREFGKRTNEDIKEAARMWCEDMCIAEAEYGHIMYWDVSEVTSMGGLFSAGERYGYEAAKQFDDDISWWEMGNVEDMSFMFYDAESFKGKGGIGRWDIGACRDFYAMFGGAKKFNGDLRCWGERLVNADNMQIMFCGASSFEGKGLEEWDVGRVRVMRWMFDGAWEFLLCGGKQRVGEAWFGGCGDVMNMKDTRNIFG
ncbi:hypothetical protein TrLO_g11531 [Triparma laevis f. longispina]|uniref:Uncharacterized protein n=1 Tax=Triparma laevis f. longispina TaxID=1714387 RepID=A0A9W7CFH4_9STRA|nr:hypothetical protein TrLO_g11531 [Triparma laevis f. longispina]